MDIALFYGSTLLAAFLMALVLTPLVRRFAISAGFIDYPKQDRVHRRPTPFLGGLAVAVSSGLALVLLAPHVPLLADLWRQGLVPRTAVPLTLLNGCAALLLGLVDDRFELNPRQKLTGQISIAVMFLLPLIGRTMAPGLLLWGLGLLWIVGLLNAFNLLDNMDGVLGGVGTIIGLFLGTLALRLGRPDLAVLALAGCGASLGFLFFNFPPASIFLGDAGAFFIGMIMAGVGWQLGGEAFVDMGAEAAAVVLILSYPIFDVTFVTVTRFLEKRPIHVGGIDHTTHRLHVLFGRGRRALWTVYVLSALSGVAGLFALTLPAPVAWTLVVLVGALYSSLGVILARVPVRSRGFLAAFLKSAPGTEREVA